MMTLIEDNSLFVCVKDLRHYRVNLGYFIKQRKGESILYLRASVTD